MVTLGGESLGGPLLAALATIAVVSFAEWAHARRVARVARLAFGPEGRPAAWARLAPAIRIAGAGLAAFGATLLLRFDPIEQEVPPNPRASRQLLVV
ncbi:MAG: hypothetical protein ACO3NL_03775, partial [Phycisphaerales bacterium]